MVKKVQWCGIDFRYQCEKPVGLPTKNPPLKMEFQMSEVVASGELYKQGHQRKSWNLRKFMLSGVYLMYFDHKGIKKGQFDISNCTIKTVTAEECHMPDAKHAFALSGPNKYLLLCASNV